MSYVPHQMPVTIRHSWNVHKSYFRHDFYNKAFSGEGPQAVLIMTDYIDETFPHVKFQIATYTLSNQKWSVVVSKTPLDPANATIRIFIERREMKKEEINCWTDDCNLYGWSHAFARNEASAYIEFECEITWHGYIKRIPTVSLYKNVKKFLKTQELADFIIAVDDDEIPVHKVILAAQSPVFLAMFKTDMAESSNNRIDVKNVRFDIMKKVIEFLYTGVIDIEMNVDIAISILSVAEQYQIMDLKKVCTEVLSMKLEVDNALKILEAAHLYKSAELKKDTSIFIILNKSEIVNLENFEELFRKQPELLLDIVVWSTPKNG